MFIHDDFVKDASLTGCDRKRTKLQLYLGYDPLVRHDVNLFQFILNLMEVMCLLQEAQKCPVGWLKLATRISSVSERNLNLQQYVGKAFRRRPLWDTNTQ